VGAPNAIVFPSRSNGKKKNLSPFPGKESERGRVARLMKAKTSNGVIPERAFRKPLTNRLSIRLKVFRFFFQGIAVTFEKKDLSIERMKPII
jgi:hypothetical protein